MLSASPHQLISMLFDGAQSAIRAAKLHMANGNVEEKGKSIGKALDIVTMGLLAALDKEKGGELAERLESIYEYVATLLLKAKRAQRREATRRSCAIGSMKLVRHGRKLVSKLLRHRERKHGRARTFFKTSNGWRRCDRVLSALIKVFKQHARTCS